MKLMLAQFKIVVSGSLAAVFLLLASCSRGDAPAQSSVAARPSPAVTATATTPDTAAEQLKFKQDNGDELFAIKFRADGAKLVDAADQEIARFTVDDQQKVKIKDPQDQVLGYIVPKDGYWKIENAAQTQELYILRRQEDGDYKLEDGADNPIYRIKVRDYGYEIETPEKQSLYKVKLRDGKVSLRNAQDVTVLSTRSEMTPIAVAAFGFDLLSQEQQAALAYAVHRTGGQ